MSKCSYIYKKGKNIGKQCNKKICVIHKKMYEEINLNICNKFISNDNINPITNRKIKKNGPIYNILNEKCLHFKNENHKTNIYIDKKENLEIISDGSKKTKIFINMDKKVVEKENVKNNIKNIPKFKDVINFKNEKCYIPNIITSEKYLWIINNKLGSGGFGKIFECLDYKYNKYAIKIEHKSSNTLLYEIEFYKTVKNYSNIIPFFYDYGIFNNLRFIVLEKLYKFKFEFGKIIKIVNIFKKLSELNYTHGDIKFSNFMERNNGELVIIDFGLSNKINKNITSKNKSGTLNYMSLNSHRGIIHYNNDLQSLAFSVLEIFHSLPWNHIKNHTEIFHKKIDLIKKILSKEEETLIKFHLDKNPILYKFLSYIFKLNNKMYPDYDYLMFILKS